MSMPEEKKVTTTEKKEVIAEKEAVAAEEPVTVKKTAVTKKTEATFVSTFPVGSKEYTDELHEWELAHAIVVPDVVISPEPK